MHLLARTFSCNYDMLKDPLMALCFFLRRHSCGLLAVGSSSMTGYKALPGPSLLLHATQLSLLHGLHLAAHLQASLRQRVRNSCHQGSSVDQHKRNATHQPALQHRNNAVIGTGRLLDRQWRKACEGGAQHASVNLHGRSLRGRRWDESLRGQQHGAASCSEEEKAASTGHDSARVAQKNLSYLEQKHSSVSGLQHAPPSAACALNLSSLCGVCNDFDGALGCTCWPEPFPATTTC